MFEYQEAMVASLNREMDRIIIEDMRDQAGYLIFKRGLMNDEQFAVICQKMNKLKDEAHELNQELIALKLSNRKISISLFFVSITVIFHALIRGWA